MIPGVCDYNFQFCLLVPQIEIDGHLIQLPEGGGTITFSLEQLTVIFCAQV